MSHGAPTSSGAAARATASEHVLANLGWIQALARRLVNDRELADDLAQEACVVALRDQPRDESQWRRWIASVLRNLVRQRHRSDWRRKHREEVTARAEATPSTAGLLEEVSAQREVVARVMELDEPYRSTVLLRYFRDLPPREIARLQGIPVNTVQSRLKRAHEKLRERLDDSFGSRETWSACFLTLALPKAAETIAPPLGTTIGALLMNLKLVLAAVAVAACAATVWISRSVAPAEVLTPGKVASPERLQDGNASLAAERPAKPGKASARELLIPDRELVSSSNPSTRVEPVAKVYAVEGRVLDGRGQPVAGIELIERDGSDLRVSSGPGGVFRLETTSEELLLRAADEGLVTVREGAWKRGSTVKMVVVVAPSIELSGRVIDEFGTAAAGAGLSFNLPDDFRSRFATILDGSRERGWSTRAGEDGSFLLTGVPGLAGAGLMASHDGFVPAVLDAPDHSRAGLQLVLERPTVPLEGTLRGQVVDASGAGVGKTRVGLGLASKLADDEGFFAFELSRSVTADRIQAIKEGFQVTVMERPDEPRELSDGAQTTGWPDFVVLTLDQPALRSSGIVLDHEGNPKSDIKIWVDDPTPFTAIGMMPATVEGLSAGVPVPAQAIESEANLPDEDNDNYWNWTNQARDPNPMWNWVESDANGRFELGGLADRPYRLIAFDEETWTRTRVSNVRAGDGDVVIRLDRPARTEELKGIVVTDHGDPVPDARLALYLPLTEQGARIRGGRSHVQLNRRGPRGRTDSDGRFSFADIRRGGVHLEVTGDEVVPHSFELTEDSNLSDLRVVVSVRCHMQVTLSDPEQADELIAEDEDGERVNFLVISHESVNEYTEVPLNAGQSGVVSLSSSARRLVLRRDGEDVARHRIHLVPGELNELRF